MKLHLPYALLVAICIHHGSDMAMAGETGSPSTLPTTHCSAVEQLAFENCPDANKLTNISANSQGNDYVIYNALPSTPSTLTETVMVEVTGGSCTDLYITTEGTMNPYFCEVTDVQFTGTMSGIKGTDADMIYTTQANSLALKLTGYEGMQVHGDFIGIEDAYESGTAYLEIDTTNATFTTTTVPTVSGISNAVVMEGVRILLTGTGNTYCGSIVGGDSSVDDFGASITGGVMLTIQSGTFQSTVMAGGVSGVINDGTQLYIGNGTFEGNVTGDGTGGTINQGTAGVAVSVLINNGSFGGTVTGAGSGSTVTGDVELFIENGSFNSTVSGVGSSGTIAGNVLTVLNGGAFEATVTAGGNGASIDGNVDLYITAGEFSSNIQGLGTSQVSGDISLNLLGGTFSDATGIYATNVDGTNTLQGNSTVTIYDSALASFSGIVDGGTLADTNTTGTRRLALTGTVGDLSRVDFRHFDSIQLATGTTATLGSNATVASLWEVNEGATLTLAQDITATSLSLQGTGAVVFEGTNSVDSLQVTSTRLTIAGNTTLETVQFTDANSVELTNNSRLTLTGSNALTALTFSGQGTLDLADGSELTLATQSQLNGLDLRIGDNATLVLDNVAESNINTLNGTGSLQLANSTLVIDGTDTSIFSGTLDGTDSHLIVRNGSLYFQSAGHDGVSVALSDNASVTLSAPASFKGMTLTNGATLRLGESAGTATTGRATRTGDTTLLALGNEGLTVGSGSTIALTVNASSISELTQQAPAITSTGAISLEDGSALTLDNLSTIATAEDESITVTLMSSDASATVGNVAVTDKILNALYSTEVKASEDGTSVILVGQQNHTNAITTPSASTTDSIDKVTVLPVNAYAGSELLWNARFDLDGALKDIFSAVLDDKDAGNTVGMESKLAALAGSTLNATGTAQRDALRNEQNSVRNRILNLEATQGHRFWIEGSGGYSHLRTQAYKGGYKLSTWGGTVGADMEVQSNFSLGVAFTANYGDLRSQAAERSTGDLDSMYLNLFGHYSSKAWGHSLILTGTTTDATLNRTVNYGTGNYTTHGSTTGYGLGALYELTYDIKLNDKGTSHLQPIIDASIVRTQLDAYNESSSANTSLRVGKQEWTTATLALGTRWSGSFGTQTLGRTLHGNLQATVSQDFGDKQGQTTVALENAPTFRQKVYGAKEGSTALQLGAGISTGITARSTIYANANVEFRNGSNNVNGTIGYRYAF